MSRVASDALTCDDGTVAAALRRRGSPRRASLAQTLFSSSPLRSISTFAAGSGYRHEAEAFLASREGRVIGGGGAPGGAAPHGGASAEGGGGAGGAPPPATSSGGKPPSEAMRNALNALLYQVRNMTCRMKSETSLWPLRGTVMFRGRARGSARRAPRRRASCLCSRPTLPTRSTPPCSTASTRCEDRAVASGGVRKPRRWWWRDAKSGTDGGVATC